jgi:glycine/D-amino acid oxidase-like deaminating enzyme
MYSRIAFASSTRVRQRCRSRTQSAYAPKRFDHGVVVGSPTVPSEGSMPALDPRSFAPGDRGDLFGPPFNEQAVLSDGGVYDNLGLETAWKRYRTILVSDGGGHMNPADTIPADWVRGSIRVGAVVDNQVRDLRKRQVVAGFLSGDRSGAYSTAKTRSSRNVTGTTSRGVPSAALLRDLGVRVPLLSGKGYSVTARGTGTAPVHPMKLLEANLACSPFDDGVRLSGMFELGGRGEGVRSRALGRIQAGAARYLRDWRPAETGLRIAGLRPATPDSLPVIGAVPGRDGVFVATGHGTLGLTLAPATAAALAPLVLHGEVAPALAPFAVSRFGNRAPAAAVPAGPTSST